MTEPATKLTGLSRANVRAVQEVFPDVATTATTATFPGTPSEATRRVSEAIARLPGRGHPKASLHAVKRRLAAQIQPLPPDDPRVRSLTEEEA